MTGKRNNRLSFSYRGWPGQGITEYGAILAFVAVLVALVFMVVSNKGQFSAVLFAALGLVGLIAVGASGRWWRPASTSRQ